ncbi:MAG: cellulase family glycosylhydrolase [Sedimentisphaerales bacterium]|nr:cellulase family glycosylhydrolase [Sedimentisphaerales bacterium]
MKTILSLGVCVILMVVSNGYSQNTTIDKTGAGAEGFVHVEGKNIVTPDGKPIHLRGMGLGNWMLPEGYMFQLGRGASHWQIQQMIKELVGPAEARAFWKEFYETFITREDIHFIKEIGLNSIRVSFNYKLFTPEDYPGVWLGPGFDMLDRVIPWSKAEGIYVVLDLHGAPGGQTGTNIDDSHGHPWLFVSKECQDRTVEIWRTIADRYKDEPTVIGYDLLNEPIPHYEGYEVYKPLLEPFYQRITAAIREVDTHHMVFIGGARWNTDFSVFGKPFDKNSVYTFHKYWMEPVQSEIQEYVDYRDKYNVPLWMGESGENTNEWIDTYRSLLDENQIGWCFWTYKRMDTTRCIRSFERPPYWDEIVAYGKAPKGLDPVDFKKHRPPLEHSRAALKGFLENIRFKNTHVNQEYIHALGL